MNPRYSQPERTTPQERRMAAFSQLQEGQQRQQQLDQQGQAGMLQQLQHLYDIQQEQENAPYKQAQMEAQTQALQQGVQHEQLFDPYNLQALQANTQGVQNKNRQEDFNYSWAQPNMEQQYNVNQAQLNAAPANNRHIELGNEALAHANAWAEPNAQQQYNMNQSTLNAAPETNRHAKLVNDNLAFENAWAQPNAEAAYGLHSAQAKLADSAANQKETISAHDIPFLVQTGVLTPDEAAQIVLPPEMRAARTASTAQKEKERQALVAADIAQQSGKAGSQKLPPDLANDPDIYGLTQQYNREEAARQAQTNQVNKADVRKRTINQLRSQVGPTTPVQQYWAESLANL